MMENFGVPPNVQNVEKGMEALTDAFWRLDKKPMTAADILTIAHNFHKFIIEEIQKACPSEELKPMVSEAAINMLTAAFEDETSISKVRSRIFSSLATLFNHSRDKNAVMKIAKEEFKEQPFLGEFIAKAWLLMNDQ